MARLRCLWWKPRSSFRRCASVDRAVSADVSIKVSAAWSTLKADGAIRGDLDRFRALFGQASQHIDVALRQFHIDRDGKIGHFDMDDG